MAADYPAPAKPGAGAEQAGQGPLTTLRSAGKAAATARSRRRSTRRKAGDTIKIADGTYHEGVTISGPAKRYVRSSAT